MSGRDGIDLALVGCDFRSASAAWRGRILLDANERRCLFERLRGAADARGLVVLETCNRVEWLVESARRDWAAELLAAWMTRLWRESAPGERPPEPYRFVGVDAAARVLDVAVGLCSLVAGEREIAGQVRRAFTTARESGQSSPILNELANVVGRTTKRLERSGRGLPARGVPRLVADEVARTALDREAPLALAVAGMGDVGRRTAALLESRLRVRVERFNRTPSATSGWSPLAELSARLDAFDVVVVATAAPEPVLDLSAARPSRSLLVVDLGVIPQVRGASRGEDTRVIDLESLSATASALDAGAERRARRAAERGRAELRRAVAVRESARLVASAQEARRRAAWEEIPALLERHAAELSAPSRRSLEAALRELVGRQHRVLLDALEGLADADDAATPPDGSPSDDAGRDDVPANASEAAP